MIIDRYLAKNLIIATVFVSVVLTGLIFLTQSLRFLELVVDSGASSALFWVLTLLAVPRSLEIILPVSLMIATTFVYHRMNMDSEIVVMRSSGISPAGISKAAIAVGVVVTGLLLFITMWLAPVCLYSMHKMSNEVKAQYSVLLLKEGVFNHIGRDLTVFIENRKDDGTLEGLIIYDSREELKNPATITARSGVIVQNDDGSNQVIVYDGSKHDYDPEHEVLNKLDFDRYSVDFPVDESVKTRWHEAGERTFLQLLNPNMSIKRDVENIDKFTAEAHGRIVSPFLAITFVVISLSCLLLGPVNRKGQGARVLAAALFVAVIYGLYLGAYNLSTRYVWGIFAMYFVVFAPMAFCGFLLSSRSEKLRYRKYNSS